VQTGPGLQLTALADDRAGDDRVSRRVASNGVISVAWQQVSVGKHRGGQVVDVHLRDRLLEVWSGNDLIRTIARDNTGTVRKRRASRPHSLDHPGFGSGPGADRSGGGDRRWRGVHQRYRHAGRPAGVPYVNIVEVPRGTPWDRRSRRSSRNQRSERHTSSVLHDLRRTVLLVLTPQAQHRCRDRWQCESKVRSRPPMHPPQAR
jgi:hypothetical protein